MTAMWIDSNEVSISRGSFLVTSSREAHGWFNSCSSIAIVVSLKRESGPIDLI